MAADRQRLRARARRPRATTRAARSRLARRDPDSRTGFEFGYSGGGPTELAICILLDFFEVYEQAPDLPVDFYGFRNALIAPADHDAERLEIEGRAIVAWMAAEHRKEERLMWRQRHAAFHFDACTDRGANDRPPFVAYERVGG